MVTYVINTSENKTFDSEILFDLAGYNKIKWIRCSLNEIKSCAETIYERQNVLGADRFRIAIIIDFYSFDRIRLPYGRRGFGVETGVEMSLYMPYIETYLMDNLITNLEKKDMEVYDFEIYYVQHEKAEKYDLLDSAQYQIKQVLKGNKDELAYSRTEKVLIEAEEEIPPEGRPPVDFQELLAKESHGPKMVEVERQEDYYRSFTLYCTPEMSLEFKMSDYPYGADEMSFSQFWHAFMQRQMIKNDLRRHYYISTYGGGASKAAFDTLSLSLYLIRIYEREEMVTSEGEMEVIHLDANVLKGVLEEAWCKINVARNEAKKNHLQYYSIYQNFSPIGPVDEPKELAPKEAIAHERATLPKKITGSKLSPDDHYKEICGFANRSAADVKKRNQEEFDDIMLKYLHGRDEARENDIEAEFNSFKKMGYLKMTDHSPSQHKYESILNQKQQVISHVFKRVLAAEYIKGDYNEEMEEAEKTYTEFKKLRAMTSRNIIGDVIFMLLAVASMIIPYYTLQLNSYDSHAIGSVILCLAAAGIFGGLFICSFILHLLPLMRKLKNARKKLRNCYLNCYAKERYSFSSIRRRYETDLLYIEHLRCELRQIKYLYEANQEINTNVRAHRAMLEQLEDCLSAMLNNLDVEPRLDLNETIDEEFDLGKPIRSKENKVYQIFSIETIEKMFPKKGREER